MTADAVEDPGVVRLRRPQGRAWTWADLPEIPDDDGHRYEVIDGSLQLADYGFREVRTVRAGESVRVDVPFPVQLRPAELAGPRRRS